MKHTILLSSMMIMMASAGTAMAQVDVTAPTMSVSNSRLNVDMDLNLANLDINSRRAVIISPYLVNGTDTLMLDKVGVYGRSQYIQHSRGNNRGIPEPSVVFKSTDAPADYHYSASVAYEPWMEGASLKVRYTRYGCAGCSEPPVVIDGPELMKAPVMPPLSDLMVYVVPPVDTVKVRQLEGRANVEFPVNKTILREDFRDNFAELGKIRASIDSVRNDKDVTIRSMQIKGFASPEGSYANNTSLARGRTEAVRRYVNNLYTFPSSLVTTSYEPEDWVGLKAWVQNSQISNRAGLLAIINNTSLSPDARDARLKSTYPAEYAMLLNTVYPSLRHTDYKINYTVRAYSDPAEILSVMKTRPGNLSLNEFYVVARTMQPGSPEYNEVFDTAARIYPDDPTANLNAANAALTAGNVKAAEYYLSKAGDSPRATHARGALALLNGRYDLAQSLLESSLKAGISQSQPLLEYIDNYKKYATSRGLTLN